MIMHFLAKLMIKNAERYELQRSPLRAAGCFRATVRTLLQCKIFRYRTRLFKWRSCCFWKRKVAQGIISCMRPGLTKGLYILWVWKIGNVYNRKRRWLTTVDRLTAVRYGTSGLTGSNIHRTQNLVVRPRRGWTQRRTDRPSGVTWLGSWRLYFFKFRRNK